MASPIYNGPIAAEQSTTPTAPETTTEQQQPQATEQKNTNTATTAAGSVAAETSQADDQSAEDSVLEAAEAAKAKQAAEPKKQQAPKKEEAPPKQEARKYKIKVDGTEEELDEETTLKLAQLGRAANKRFQEAAALRKQSEDFINLLKTDPRKVLSNPAIGVDLKKFAEDYLIEQIEQEKLTPEQIKIKELESFKAQVEEEKHQAELKRQDEQKRQLEEHYARDYEEKFQAALGSSGLPRTPYTVKRMAEYMSMAIKNGIGDIEPKNVVELVRQDYMKDVAALLGQSDGDALLQILGDQIANKIRKTDLARLKAGNPQKQTATPATPNQQKNEQPRNPVNNRYMTTHEWREWQKSQVQK
jgi:hypothetical protein